MASAELIAVDMSRSVSGPDTAQPARGDHPPSWLWAFGAALLVLGLAYAPNFLDLVSIWSRNPNYSHGPLVIPIAVWIFWRRLSNAKQKPTFNSKAASYWGWAFLAVILALRVIAYERNARWSENATIVPAVTCLAWIFGGWSLLYVAWPAIAFLLFMLPLPEAVNNSISLSLQGIATAGSCYLLQLSRIWVVQRGNTIDLTTNSGEMGRLEVAAACSGLSMLMTLAAVVTATIILIPLPTWKRVTILASAVPIALASNILRIVGTGWCYYFMTEPTSRHWAHDISGWLMMPVALAFVALELRVLSWLVPEETLGEGCDLQLMPSVNEVNDIPNEGRNLTIVAAVNDVLHFRIFDADGNVVVNTNEKKLTGQVNQIKNLKKQLTSLWLPHELSRKEAASVVSAVSSVIGHTPGEYEGKVMIRALSEKKEVVRKTGKPREATRKFGLGALLSLVGWKRTAARDEPNVILPALIEGKKKSAGEFGELQ
jgi:exosortase